MSQLFQLPVLLAFPALLVVAALRDCTTFTIPNWISLALLAAFPPAAFMAGLSLPTMGVALSLFVAGLLLGMGMFAAGWLGGGDAKLLAAAAPWLGLAGVGPFLLVTAVAGGGLALTLLWLRSNRVTPFLAKGPSWVSRLAKPGENVPYGVAIAIGALAAFPQSEIARAMLTAF